MILLRVSTDEQYVENQLPALQRMAAVRDLDVIEVVEEEVSAVKRRDKLDELLARAHRGEYDVLLIWALDRLQRSMIGTLLIVAKLAQCNVVLLSAQEPWLDTVGPARELLLAIVGSTPRDHGGAMTVAQGVPSETAARVALRGQLARARLAQWWHLLTQSLRSWRWMDPCHGVNYWHHGRRVRIGCACGRRFWEERSPEARAVCARLDRSIANAQPKGGPRV